MEWVGLDWGCNVGFDVELLMKEAEDKMKEEEDQKAKEIIEEEKEPDEEKCEPEDPEQRSIFISEISKKLKESDVRKLCERKIW